MRMNHSPTSPSRTLLPLHRSLWHPKHAIHSECVQRTRHILWIRHRLQMYIYNRMWTGRFPCQHAPDWLYMTKHSVIVCAERYRYYFLQYFTVSPYTYYSSQPLSLPAHIPLDSSTISTLPMSLQSTNKKHEVRQSTTTGLHLQRKNKQTIFPSTSSAFRKVTCSVTIIHFLFFLFYVYLFLLNKHCV